MRLHRVIVLSTLVVMALFIPSGCSPPERPPRQLKFSVITRIDSSWYKAAVRFADLVRERTRGKFTVTVFPDSQLAGGNQLKELDMLREGKIDFTFDSTLLLANLDSEFYVVSMPWMSSNYEEVDRFLSESGGRKLLELASNYGIIGLAFGENGFRQLTNSKRVIRTPDDIKGLRVRVPNAPMFISVFKALGAEPTIMNWKAVYKALQEDVMEGQENPLDIIVASKLYDIQKYITLWNYSYDAFILGVNRKLYNSLDGSTQEILRQSAKEAAAYQVQLSREAALNQLGLLKEKGMVVTALTPMGIKSFRDKVQAIYADYEPVVGKDLLNELQAIGGQGSRP